MVPVVVVFVFNEFEKCMCMYMILEENSDLISKMEFEQQQQQN